MVIGVDIRTLMEKEYSGVPEFTQRLLRELLRIDKNNQYRFFFNSARDLSGRMPVFASSNLNYVRSRYPNKLFNLGLQKILGIPKLDRLLDCGLFFMPAVNFISLSRDCRKILTVHDLSFLKHKEFYSAKRNLWHSFVNVPKLIKACDTIVAVSENTKQDIIDLCGIEPSKIKVIYSGVGAEYGQIESTNERLAEVKVKYNLPDKFIFHLGTFEPRKNLLAVIKAYDRLLRDHEDFRGYKMVIAGGRGWKNREIYRAMRTAREAVNIRHIGYVDNEDKKYLYNLADLFAYTSHYEGFGFPPLEAMACGTPVVISSTSSLPEVAGRASIMVNPNDYREISEAFYLILSNNKLKTQLQKQGMDMAGEFTWEKAARSYLDLFNN